jgi:hypothetical protein
MTAQIMAKRETNAQANASGLIVLVEMGLRSKFLKPYILIGREADILGGPSYVKHPFRCPIPRTPIPAIREDVSSSRFAPGSPLPKERGC